MRPDASPMSKENPWLTCGTRGRETASGARSARRPFGVGKRGSYVGVTVGVGLRVRVCVGVGVCVGVRVGSRGSQVGVAVGVRLAGGVLVTVGMKGAVAVGAGAPGRAIEPATISSVPR